MSRILRHVGNKDFRRTRQRQIGEQKERAAQKLKEWEEAEAERKQIEEIARPFKSNWREETQLQESDWTPVAGSIANSTSQTFEYPGGSRVTVSGLGGVEAMPSSVSVTQSGDTFNVDAPNYSQLGLQGYAKPLGGVQRQTQQSENERIDAEIRRLEEQIKESKAKETAAIDAWNAELRATMDRHGREWEAVLKKDGVYNPEKHKGLQARHGAEMDAIWNKEPKTEPYETERQNLRAKIFELEKQRPINQQLDVSQEFAQKVGADEFMNARVQDLTPLSKNPFGIDYGEIASTNLRGLLQDPNSNYSMNRKGELSGLKYSMYGKYMNPFVRGNPVTERDLNDKDRDALRRHIQQLLDHPNAEDPTAAGWKGANGEDIYAPIRKRERVTREQARTYGMRKGDRIYSLSPYINSRNRRVKDLKDTNDLATLMGNTTVITDRRGRVKRVVDDIDFSYGYERGDSGLPGTPVTKRKSGPTGMGYVEKGERGAAEYYTGVPEQLGRIGVSLGRGIGLGNPIPMNIKFR